MAQEVCASASLLFTIMVIIGFNLMVTVTVKYWEDGMEDEIDLEYEAQTTAYLHWLSELIGIDQFGGG